MNAPDGWSIEHQADHDARLTNWLQVLDGILAWQLGGTNDEDRRIYDGVAPYANPEGHPDQRAWSSALILTEHGKDRIAKALLAAVAVEIIAYEEAAAYALWLGNAAANSLLAITLSDTTQNPPLITTI